jgi:hypothetical protein
MSWANKDTLTFDNPVQRSGSQWSLLQKSLLIHSLLASFPTPSVYLIKAKDEQKGTTYSCLEGKQRLTSIFAFINGEYALHGATPEVTLDETTYDLANLHFEDLSDECKDAILGYRFSVYCLEECSDEEVEEVFRRLNNSTPLSPIQKCRSVMGTELSRWTKEICQSDFLVHSTSFTVAQLRRESDLEVVLQSMLLIDSMMDLYSSWKGISTSEVTKYCAFIRGRYDDDRRLLMMELMEYLGQAFPEKHKFLKKSNVPMVITLSKLAQENHIVPNRFRDFIDEFSESDDADYAANCGSGNVKREKTEGRLLAIANAFAKYFSLPDVNILGIAESEGVSEPSDGQGETDATEPDPEENSEGNGETPSSDEQSPSEGENAEVSV